MTANPIELEEPESFEVRLSFLQFLNPITPSKTAIARICQEALTYIQHHETIFTCIKEMILDEKTTPNALTGLLYLIDSLCHHGSKTNTQEYLEHIRKDMSILLPRLAKGDSDKVGKIIMTWRQRNIATPELVKEWESLCPDIPSSTPQKQLSLNDINKRMDDDREKQKRRREETASRPIEEDSDAEFEEWWEASALLLKRHNNSPGGGNSTTEKLLILPSPLIEYVDHPVKRIKFEIEKKPTPKKKRVFIWDLDETLIIFQSLLNQSFARKHSKNASEGRSLGIKMESLIFSVADESFFYRTLDGIECTHIDQFANDDDHIPLDHYDFRSDGFSKMASSSSSQAKAKDARKCAYRFRKIKDYYNTPNVLKKLLSEKQFKEWNSIYTDINKYTNDWLEFATKIVESSLIHSKYETVNYLVSSGGLVPTLAKLLLFRLAHCFQVDHIYSSSPKGKVSCFQQIKAKYTDEPIMVIGDSEEEEQAASKLKLDFVKIQNKESLINLYNKFMDEPENKR